jgi:hypothetical protein
MRSVRGLLGAPVTMAAVTFRSTLKPGQVETPLDLYFFRPAAYLFVRLALPTPLSANGMTAISILCGLAGAVLFRFTAPPTIYLASALTLLYGVLDCADGQLARARGTSSRLGRILDGMSDYVVGVASGVSMSLHLSDTMGRQGVWLAVGGLASILLQGTLFDHFKNRYLTLSASTYRRSRSSSSASMPSSCGCRAPSAGRSATSARPRSEPPCTPARWPPSRAAGRGSAPPPTCSYWVYSRAPATWLSTSLSASRPATRR